MSKITDFYSGKGTDHMGRTLAGIMGLPDDQLEPCHDYIQWLFPLPEASAYFPEAPQLTTDDVDTFEGDPAMQAAVLASLDRMLLFYGLPARDAHRKPDPARIGAWATERNHNLLRLTRILRSLELLGFSRQSRWLLRQLAWVYAQYGAKIGPVTLGYWAAAAAGSDGTWDAVTGRGRITPDAR